ncbi:hypothetical protein [Bacillus sp. Brlt_9]|uniref:hypothetical protein n=1 Tax=Bacillus sp. Brlt_9 TaxID=3110916 RepID=UPI003F7B9289
MYSLQYKGWIGKVDEVWIKEARTSIFSSLFQYYIKRITPGQKLFIGYDNNISSQYLAEEAANYFSESGLPVFISTRPLATSMLQAITKERYGCGSLSFVVEDYKFPHVGLKASNMDGIFIAPEDLTDLSSTAKHKKQSMDSFDPTLNLKNYIENNLNLSTTSKPLQSLVWNAMHSPLSPILEELFIEIFDKNSIDAYTINSFENSIPKKSNINPEYQDEIEQTCIKLNSYHCNFGITTTSDLTNIDIVKKEKENITSLEFEDIIYRILPYLGYQENMIISEDITFNASKKHPVNITKVSEGKFFGYIKENSFSIAIDSEYNIYIHNELFPNHFAVLFCLFHSILYGKSKEHYSKSKISESKSKNNKTVTTQ